MYAYIYTYIIYVVNSTIIIDVYRQRIIKKERPKEDEITIYGSCIGIPYVATVASTKTKHIFTQQHPCACAIHVLIYVSISIYL